MRIKRPLHILLISSWFPSKVNRYAGDFVQRHAKAISTLHKVTVVYAIGSFENKEVEENAYEEGNYKEIIVVFPKSKYTFVNWFRKWKIYLKKISEIGSFDIVHVNVAYPVGLLALYLKKIKKYPYVITEHWTGYLPQDPNTIEYFRKFATRKILENASYLLPVSESLGEALLKYGKNKNLKVIRNVVDTNIFQFKPDHQNSTFKFLHISNLSYQKNIDGMLNVSKRLWEEGYEFIFEIGGNGDLNPLYDFQNEYKLEKPLQIFGALTQFEVAEKMQNADCFVLFSRFENQPCVQNESFCTGLPIIASDVGGISELLPKEFGLVVESENEDQLYDAMKSCLNGHLFAEKSEIHDFAENQFSVSHIAQRFNEVYQEILKNE